MPRLRSSDLGAVCLACLLMCSQTVARYVGECSQTSWSCVDQCSFCLKDKLYQCPPKTWCYLPRGDPEPPSEQNIHGPCVPDNRHHAICPLAGSALASYVISDRQHPLKQPPAPPNDADANMYVLFRHKPHWWPDSEPWPDILGMLERQKAKQRQRRQQERQRKRQQQRQRQRKMKAGALAAAPGGATAATAAAAATGGPDQAPAQQATPTASAA